MHTANLTYKGLGTRRDFQPKEGRIDISPMTVAAIDSARGLLRRNPGERPVTEELIQAHADEVAEEEAEILRHGRLNKISTGARSISQPHLPK